jgi:hypothetical protein
MRETGTLVGPFDRHELRRQRQMPSAEVERAVPREIRLMAIQRSTPSAIEHASDVLHGTPVGLSDYEPATARS